MGSDGPLPQSRRLQVLKGERKRAGRPVTNPPTAMVAAPPKPDDLGEWGEFMWDLVTPELETPRVAESARSLGAGGVLPAVRAVEGPFPGRPVVESGGRADVAPGPEPGVFAGGPVADGVTGAKGGARAFDFRSGTREPVRRACHRGAQTSSIAICAASTVSKGPTVVIGETPHVAEPTRQETLAMRGPRAECGGTLNTRGPIQGRGGC